MIECVDLFCGVGGLTHGLAKGGVRVVAGIDLDPECRFPYETNNSAKFLELDVHSVSGEYVCSLWTKGEHTLLAGCAPCQPFSTYGRQKGKHPGSKKRWDLVSDFARLAREAKPDLVTMENVPQLVHHKVFDQLISSLSEYHISWQIIDCVQYGVPQTRKRLVLLASRLGPIELVSAQRFKRRKKATVRQAISSLPQLNAGDFDPTDSLHSACKLSELNLRRIKASTPGGTWREWDESLLAKCHKKESGATYPSVYGRMEWEKPAPTITTQCFGYGNGRFGHPEQNRAITLREAALLQTFPRTYKFVKKGEKVRYNVLGRLIGNAVPVKIGEIVAESLHQHIQQIDSGNRQKTIA